MSHPANPVARQHDLVIKTVGDKLLVYDLERHRAHSLNRVAAAVWRRCDGARDADRIAAELRIGNGVPVTQRAVEYALGELARARLLTGPVARVGLTRREVVRRLGTAAAVALPLVTTIVAPTAAAAQSEETCILSATLSCTVDSDCPPCTPPRVRVCDAPDPECFCCLPGG